MVQKDATVKLVTGIHARPAADLVKLANEYSSDIKIIYKDKNINLKDIWDVLNNGIESGDKITVVCEGEDEQVALYKIITFISNEEES